MLTIKNKIALIATSDSILVKAKELARQLNLPLVEHNQSSSYPFLLAVTPERLELRESNIKSSKPIYVDFLAPSLSYRIKYGGGNKQLIAKAIGIKSGIRLTVLDTTTGLGVDAFLLASLGCNVVMLERSPIIWALLRDGLGRFKKNALVKNIKMELYCLQAQNYLIEIIHTKIKKPDVIYLDPMYPERQKAALGKKTMRVLHELVGADNDATELLTLALQCANKRVVVKRLSYAPNLSLIKPNLKFSANGSCRYDVYFVEK
ncbi:MAG: class I SAM-dependent methyltransferase [bacterium]